MVMLDVARFILSALAVGAIIHPPLPMFATSKSSGTTAFSWTINGATDLDVLPANCDVLVGYILIGQNYTGAFTLNRITNVTGGLWTSSTQDGFGLPNLTSIEMNDVEYMGSIEIVNSTALESISMRSLTSIDALLFDAAPGTSFDFAALSNASHINLSGNISSLNFPLLVGVDSVLEIIGSHGLDINFPALQNASGMHVAGNFLRISMPLLTIAQKGYLGESFGITARGNPTNLTFPNLQVVDDVTLSGSIQSLSLPSLLTVPGTFLLEADYPISVNLSSLESAKDILLEGYITGAAFPALTSLVDDMEIVSDSHIDCADAMTAYNRSHLHTTNGTFECSRVVQKSIVPLSKGTKAGIGIAVALPTLLVIIYFLRKWIDKRKKAEREKNAPTGVELEGRNGVEGGDHPPDYFSVAATETGSVHSEATPVQGRERDEPLPQYSRGDLNLS